MELVDVVGGLIALAGLAPWLGRDTGERLISAEERFASFGLTWGLEEHRAHSDSPARRLVPVPHLVASWLTSLRSLAD